MREVYLAIMLLVMAVICTLLSIIRRRSSNAVRWSWRGLSLLFILAALLLPLFKLGLMRVHAKAPLIAPELGDYRDNGIVYQTSGFSCTPAAMANLLASHDVLKTEKELAELFRTTKFGTADHDVRREMKKMGFLCRNQTIEARALDDFAGNCLLFIYHPATGPDSHTVFFRGVEKGKLTIIDPLKGERNFSRDELRELWNGQIMAVRKMPQQASDN